MNGTEITGIFLIKEERIKQLVKHQRSIENDVKFNNLGQLKYAAIELLKAIPSKNPPYKWDEYIWNKMIRKHPYKRAVIAGALITADLDRLLNLGFEELINK